MTFLFLFQVIFSVPVMVNVLVGLASLDCAATPVLLSTTGIHQARDVSSVNVMLLALLVGTVMIPDIARVRPTLLDASVIGALLITMVLQGQEGKK